jgi:hypothetical protein
MAACPSRHPNMLKEVQLEIAHVLFVDTVGYSKLSINEQAAAVDELNEVVCASEQFQKAEAAGRLMATKSGACA